MNTNTTKLANIFAVDCDILSFSEAAKNISKIGTKTAPILELYKGSVNRSLILVENNGENTDFTIVSFDETSNEFKSWVRESFSYPTNELVDITNFIIGAGDGYRFISEETTVEVKFIHNKLIFSFYR